MIQPGDEQLEFNQQLKEYSDAIRRLERYQLSVGREETEVTIKVATKDFDRSGLPIEIDEVVTLPAIEPIEATVEQTTYDVEGNATVETIENPLITKDNEERAAAQAIIDATPQEVIDAYNEEQV